METSTYGYLDARIMNKNILVVDDEESIRKMLNEAFSKNGYQVMTAASGEEALYILDHKNIQVIFLDLQLPGMSGLELCREIRKSNAITCIYAVTGYCRLFELVECREAGFDDYFNKPVKLSMLFKAAQDAFEKISRWTKRSGE